MIDEIKSYLEKGYNSINFKVHEGNIDTTYKYIPDYQIRNHKNFVNHISFANFFCEKYYNNQNSYTQNGLALLYMVLRDLTLETDHTYMYKIFNKNQEVLNLPFPIVLFLGGLYYFHENRDELEYDIKKVFYNTNGYKDNEYLDKIVKSISSVEYVDKFDKHTAPNIRIFNRSFHDDNDFNIPTNGFGIQNRYINAYNSYMLDEHSGYTSSEPFAAKQSTVNLKPLKTYNSDIEFSSFYRNLSINDGFNYNTDQFKNTFELKIKDLLKFKRNNNETDFNGVLIDIFLIICKLKVLYISKKINKDKLKELVTSLCDFNYLGENVCDFYYLIFYVYYSFYNIKNISTGIDIDKHNIVSKPINRIKSTLNPTPQLLSFDFIEQTSLPDIYLQNVNNQVNNIYNLFINLWDKESQHLNDKYNNLDDKSTFLLYPSAGGICYPHKLFYTFNEKFEFNEPINVFRLRSNNLFFDKNIGRGRGGRSGTNLFILRTEYDRNLSDIDYGVLNRLQENGIFYKKAENKVALLKDNLSDILQGVVNRAPNFNLNKEINYTITPFEPQYLLPVLDSKVNLSRIGLNNISYVHYDNPTILKNSSRLFWFDTNQGLDITNFGDVDKLNVRKMIRIPTITNYFSNINTSGELFLYTKSFDYIENLLKNKQFFDYINTEPYDKFLDYRKDFKYKINEDEVRNKVINIEKYKNQFKFNTIIDSLDFEKLEHFKDMFLNFCDENFNNYENNYQNFSLKGLIKSINIIGSSELQPISYNNKLYNSDDISLLLIGNDGYLYDFYCVSMISGILNSSLTYSQKYKYEESISEFSKGYTIQNSSQYGSVETGEYKLNIHNLITMPEVLFAGVNNYDELIEKYREVNSSLTDKDLNSYFFRKIYFGDQFIKPFNENYNIDDIDKFIQNYIQNNNLTFNVLSDVNLDALEINLPSVELMDRSLPFDIDGLIENLSSGNNFIDELDELDLSAYDSFQIFKDCVIYFFKMLNIELTTQNMKHLIKPLRSFIFFILKDNNILNEDYIYGNKIIN